MTEKRTTRKKAEPQQAPDVEVEEKAEVPPKPQRTAPPWPFEEDHYLSIPTTSRRSHSDGTSVLMVQKALGVVESGEFDNLTAAAVGAFQRLNDLPVTRVVDRATWEALHG